MDPVILQDLREAYESGQLVVFAGAGVSEAAGLPAWRELAELLVERARARPATSAELEEIAELIRNHRSLDAFSAAKRAMGPESFHREITRALDDKDRPVPPIAQAIAALRPKLQAVLTTNLDRLLERAFGGDWEPVTSPPAHLLQQRHYILKLHGRLGDARTWVFSREQHDVAMYGSSELQDAFGALYATHPMLFVGFVPDDPLEQMLGRVRALAKGQPPTHYALLREPVPPYRRSKLEQAGLRLLAYDNRDGAHAEAVKTHLWLGAQPANAAVEPAVAAPAPTAPAPVSTATGPVRVVVLHASEDEEHLKNLEKHLVMLKRQSKIALWHRGMVPAGADVEDQTMRELDAAEVILVLVSNDLLASDDRYREAEHALRRRQAGATVMPVLLRECDLEGSGLRALQPLAKSMGTLVGRANLDEAFAKIAKELRHAVEARRDSR